MDGIEDSLLFPIGLSTRSELLAIDRESAKQSLENALQSEDIGSVRSAVYQFVEECSRSRSGKDEKGNGKVTFPVRSFEKHIRHIVEAHGIKRAKYYIVRLLKAIETSRTTSINDINLNRWQDYDSIITDSLWMLDKRDTSGAHVGWYWGNFVPQIPNQLIQRYTKKGDWVIDPFLGSGTTLIECRRLGRNGIGVELNTEVCRKAEALIATERPRDDVRTALFNADSVTADFGEFLKACGTRRVHLAILHPPYHDIIKFSDSSADLSNARDVTTFVSLVGDVADNVRNVLARRRYMGIVIGDKYSRGEWIPLGFYVMQEVMKRGFSLKSIVVKNFGETRGKRNQKGLWRYRALVGGFYVFKHEYILIFRKE